jgi:phosphatidylglycerol lysyltransferase
MLKLTVLGLSAAVLFRSGEYLWRELSTDQVTVAWDYMHQLNWIQGCFALLLTLLAYGTHIVFEAIAWRSANRAPAPGLLAAVALVGAGISNSLGQFWLTGTTIRLRLYGLAGLPVSDAARIAAIVFVNIWLGYAVIAGIVGLMAPGAIAEFMPAGLSPVAIGSIWIAAPALYLICAALRPPGKLGVMLPSVLGAVTQICVSVIRVSLTAGALFVLLLPVTSELSYLEVLAAFVCGVVAGAFGQVPGAFGVLEATVLFLIGQRLPAGIVLAALGTFRILYYFLPLITAAAVLAAWEAHHRRL